MREVIPLARLLEDLKVACNVVTTLPEVLCEIFKDNQSCVDVFESKKLPARIKHITIKYHYFRSLVYKGTIKIYLIISNKVIFQAVE